MKCLAPVFAGLLLLTAIFPIQAGVITTGVDIHHQLNFTDPFFADATWSSTVTIAFAPGSSGSKDFNLLFYPENYGLTFFSTGSVAINQTTAPPQTSATTLHVTATGGGTFGFHESAGWQELGPDTLDPLGLYTSARTGRRILDFYAPAGDSLQLDAGITWRTTVSMPGDWSPVSFGDVQGAHYLYSYDSDWSLTNDFVYNSATNQTVFSLFNPNYAGANSEHDGSRPEFALVGPVIPEPSAGALSAGGLLLVATYASMQGRRRKSPSGEI